MKIQGANLGTIDADFHSLSSYNWTKEEKIQKIICKIEKMYLENIKKCEMIEISPLDIDDENKVVIEKGMLNHRCSGNLETLRSVAKYGILASEWFGVLESEQEGRFCTFTTKTKGQDYFAKGSLAEDDNSMLNIGKNVVLFLDSTNEVMQNLLHLDYFEYENVKNNFPDKIDEIYTSEEIEMFDMLIEKLSPSGMGMRESFECKTNYWSAIPGGIPSTLVNGICIKRNNYTDEELDEINNLFPNAVIFNNEKKVVRYPIISKENNKTR